MVATGAAGLACLACGAFRCLGKSVLVKTHSAFPTIVRTTGTTNDPDGPAWRCWRQSERRAVSSSTAEVELEVGDFVGLVLCLVVLRLVPGAGLRSCCFFLLEA